MINFKWAGEEVYTIGTEDRTMLVSIAPLDAWTAQKFALKLQNILLPAFGGLQSLFENKQETLTVEQQKERDVLIQKSLAFLSSELVNHEKLLEDMLKAFCARSQVDIQDDNWRGLVFPGTTTPDSYNKIFAGKLDLAVKFLFKHLEVNFADALKFGEHA